MVSGMSDINYAIEAMRHGAFDYVTKPFDLSQVLMAVDLALRYQVLIAEKRLYEQSLEEAVRLKTAELRSLNSDLNQMLEALQVRHSLRRRDSLARVHKRNSAVTNLLIQVRHCLIDQFVQLINKHPQLACQLSQLRGLIGSRGGRVAIKPIGELPDSTEHRARRIR